MIIYNDFIIKAYPGDLVDILCSLDDNFCIVFEYAKSSEALKMTMKLIDDLMQKFLKFIHKH